MRSADKILLIFAVLYAHSNVQALEYRTYRKEWRFQENATFKFGQAIATNDNSFLFAICSEERLPAEINCNVTIATPVSPWKDNRSNKRTCNLKLAAIDDGKTKHEVTRIVSVERFAKDRAIVLWWEREKLSQYQIKNIKVSVLHMADCSTVHLTFPIDVEGHVLLSNVVLYPSTFDVIISNKEKCGAPTCRITHNIEGQQIGEPTPFVTNFAVVRTEPVSLNSSIQGFFLSGSDLDSTKFRAIHFTPSGAVKSLMTVTVSDPRQVYRTTSNSHELYGICLMGNKRIHCAQFDAKANVRMNATVKVSGAVDWMAVHNLVKGGVLLLTGQCKDDKCRSFRIIKIHADGRHQKAIDVPRLHLKCSQVPHEFSVDVSENENDFCFYLACGYLQNVEKKELESSVKLSIRCVPKYELKL